MSAYVYLSTKAGKKYTVEYDGKKIHFGASGYQDYTIHKDNTRKERYIMRHQARENWSNPKTPGFWSRWLLWNKPTLKASAADIRRQFGIKLVF